MNLKNIEILVAIPTKPRKIQNETVQISLEQIKADIIKVGKFKNDANLIDYIINYILELEEQNVLMRESTNKLRDILAEYDPELREYMEVNKWN